MNFYNDTINYNLFNNNTINDVNTNLYYNIEKKPKTIYIVSLFESEYETDNNNDYYCISFNFNNITETKKENFNCINKFKELLEKSDLNQDELKEVNLLILLYTLNYLIYKEPKTGGSSIKNSYQLYINDKNRYYIIYNNKNIYLNKNNTYKKDNCLYLKINNNLDVNIKIN